MRTSWVIFSLEKVPLVECNRSEEVRGRFQLLRNYGSLGAHQGCVSVRRQPKEIGLRKGSCAKIDEGLKVPTGSSKDCNGFPNRDRWRILTVQCLGKTWTLLEGKDSLTAWNSSSQVCSSFLQRMQFILHFITTQIIRIDLASGAKIGPTPGGQEGSTQKKVQSKG